MSKIYDFPFSFRLVKNYMVFCFKRFYGAYVVLGKENIPAEGPIIFAPNHTNALMDALAVHAIAPKDMAVIFLARADLFQNKTAAKYLQFAKILPAFRMRDGMENLGRNNEVFDRCVEVLDNKKALGIMPEGNQEIERKLRPLVKGIFRIAFAAQQKYGLEPGVKIIPVGIDYGSIVKANKHIIINIGKPIEVSEYMNAYADNAVDATTEIRDRLRNELGRLSLDLATDKYYDCFEMVLELANRAVLEELQLPYITASYFAARQAIAERLVNMEKNAPEEMQRLEKLCLEYTAALKKIHIKSKVLDEIQWTISGLIGQCILLLITSPLFAAGFLLNFLPFFLPVFIRKYIIKPEFTGFISSIQYALGLITFPVFYILQSVLFFSLTDVPLWKDFLFIFLQYPLLKCALTWYNWGRKYLINLRYEFLKQIKSPKLVAAMKLREQIIRMISL